MNYILEKAPHPSLRAKEIVFEKLNTPVLYEKSGKPYTEKMNISISHSGSFVLVGFCESPIGVDIEALRAYDKRLISRYFSKDEQEYIKTDEDFFTLWTVKEAYLKMTGEGLKGMKKQNVVKNGKVHIDGCITKVFTEKDCAVAIVYNHG